MKNRIFNFYLCSALFMLSMFLPLEKVTAQVSGIKSIPADYATVSAFVLDLNTNGVGLGGVTLNVPAGYAETATAVISLTATGTVTDQIIIQKSGVGSNPLITAYTGGTGTPGSAVQDGIFALVGSDYVTINGIDLTENAANATNPSTMEYGYGLFKASATDGCQYNQIINCSITLNKINNASGTSPAFDGSRGINVVNSLISTQTTSITITAVSGSNSFNQFYSNTIQNVNIGIALSGYQASSPFTLADTGNDIGGTSLPTGNTLIDFGGAAAATNPAAGIRTIYQYNLNASYNTLNNNTGAGAYHGSTLRGILIGTATSASLTLNNNSITLVSGGTTSQMDGISNAAGSTALSNTIDINNNTLQIAYSTATSATINGITNSGTSATVNISGNTITNVSSLPALQNVIGGTGTVVLIEGGSPNNLNITNNFLTTFARSGASGSWRGIKITSPPNCTISGNTIENLSYTNVTSTGGIDGIYSLSSAVNVSISNNIVRNLSIPTTGTINGIREFGVSGIKLITGNDVYNFSTTSGGAGGATFNGIYCSTGTVTVSGNKVYSLVSTGTTGGTGGVISGINMASSSSPWTISANKLYTLSSTSTGTGQIVNGILASTGSGSISNNVISGLNAPNSAGTDAVRGISLTSTTTSSILNVNYNSVYLNAVSAGANFGSSGIFHTGSTTATTATLNLQNNLIINESVPAGTGNVVAFRRSTANAANLSAGSNNNLLFAGTPAANRLIYTDGTPQQTLLGYVSTVLPLGHDINSATGEAFSYSTPGSFFISLTGASADFLKPVAGIVTQAESGAVNIAGITSDYASVIRAGNLGYLGTGSNPDMGAFEFEGMSPAPQIALISVTPPVSTQCSAADRTILASATTLSGTITGVNIVYSVNGVPQTNIPMTFVSGSTYTGLIPIPVPSNATIAWGITATNSVGLSSTYNGTGYADEPLFGITASATASNSVVCAGVSTDLEAAFSTGTLAAYTSPPAVANPTTDEDFGNITIMQGATTILNNTSAGGSLTGTIGTASGTGGSYSNFTAFGPYMLNHGVSYTFSATSITQGGNFGNAIGIWIDYNRNGSFADPGEKVYSSASTTSGPHTETGSFTVPTNAGNGLTLMRVLVNEGSITGPTQAVSWGEYEEYLINLNPAITSVSWMDGVTNIGTGNPLSTTPLATTTYTANIESSGCTLAPSPTVTVTVNPLPTAPTAMNSAQCGTQIPTATVSSTTGAGTPLFIWYDAPVSGNTMQNSASTTYLSNVATTTTFYVCEVDMGTGCESPRTAVTVTVASADGILATASSVSICIGDAVALTASNTNPSPNQSYSYTWTSVAGSGISSSSGASVTPTPTSPGVYVYDLSGVDGACNAVSSISVTVNPFTVSINPVDITCYGYNNGTFTVASSSCGTMPYSYSVDNGSFNAIPTDLTQGLHTVIVQDFNGYMTGVLPFTINEPTTIIAVPDVTDAIVCQNSGSALVTANSTVNLATSGSIVVPFDVTVQPVETNAAPGNIIATSSYTLPANATVTGGTLNYNGISAIGSSWMSDVRLGFSGAVTNSAATGTGSTNSSGTFNYTRSITAASINAAGGTVDLLYWDYFSDNAGVEATFPTGAGVATLTINYTVPTPTTISWWTDPVGGTQIGVNSPFETVGTSVLPNTGTPGVYTVYAQGEYGGCNGLSRTAATVTINPVSTGSFATTACSSYTWGANTYNSSGLYTQTFTNALGCDSVVSLNLTINNPSTSVTTVVDCDSYTWTNGTTYTTSGTYSELLVNALGCDSLATLLLTINNSSATTDMQTACGSFTWIDGITYTSSNNTAMWTLTNASGCDSIVSLDLTLNYPSTGTDVQTACDSYTWINGVTYTSGTNTPTYTFPNAAGCDSIVTLNLTLYTTPIATATDNGDATLTASTGASYQWINCISNQLIPGETFQSLTVTSNGSYAVIVSNGSCSDTSSCVVINNIGLDELSVESIIVAPNPTNDDVTISMSYASATVHVMDAQGKLLYSTTVENGAILSLAAYESGMYYLRINTEDGTSLVKVFKN